MWCFILLCPFAAGRKKMAERGRKESRHGTQKRTNKRKEPGCRIVSCETATHDPVCGS